MKKIRLGISGLGRLGAIHAQNLAFRIPGCELVAACDLDSDKLAWTKEFLAVKHTYTNYKEMCSQDDLDGIFSVSPTALHGEQIITALESGKHIFCEKPLAITIKECLEIENRRKEFPDLIVMMGFNRRYDPAYVRLKAKVDKGVIGKPFLVSSSSGDMNDTAEFQIQFAPKSGGIFLDVAVHDIDTINWISGQKFKRIFGVGGAYCHHGFAEFNDADNVFVLAEQEDGTIATISITRNSFYGDVTDLSVQGTKGYLHANRQSRIDQLDEYLEGGIKIQCTTSFIERFEKSFIIEADAFVNHIRNNTQPALTLNDATYTTKAAIACRLAFQNKSIVNVNDVTD